MINIFSSKKKWVIFLVIFLVTIPLLFYFLLNKKIKAERVYFYPQSCLGSFVNPEKAQGEPEVDDLSLINDSNSAVYFGETKEIYCGDFRGPIEEGEINKITLKLNLLLSNEKKEASAINSPNSSQEKSFIEEIIPDRQVEVINNSNNTATDSPKLMQDSKPTSLKFFKIVYAQESNVSEITNSQSNPDSQEVQPEATSSQSMDQTESTISSSENSSSSNSLETSSETSNSTSEVTTSSSETTSETTNSTTSTSSVIEINSETNSLISQPLFDISYTLDGQVWNYLGSINSENWQEISFEIPVNEWILIPKIQVKIQSNSTIKNIPYLYVESLSVEVEYLSEETKEDQVLSDQELLNTNSDFSSQEPLKERRVEKIINLTRDAVISCDSEPFSILIQEGNSYKVNMSLDGKTLKKLEIGDLPLGIDVTFEENSDYLVQTDKNTLTLNIKVQKGAQKGNFNIPVVYESDSFTTVCQINVINF
ncbi:MAG: hypothetical protein N2Z68_02915 [Patescibacteria group bacterium]|nr:hypothetical protein [Patescibacteria group bacterium]